MKFTAMLFTLTTAILLVTSFDVTSAAECTAEQLLANGNARLTVTSSKDCAVFNTGTQTEAETCADTKCLAVIKKAVANFADCTLAGINFKKTLDNMIESCSTSTSSTSTTTTTSAPAADKASAAASTKTSVVTIAATSVLAAVAMRL